MTQEEKKKLQLQYPGLIRSNADLSQDLVAWDVEQSPPGQPKNISAYAEPINLDQLVLPHIQFISQAINDGINEIDLSQTNLVSNQNNLQASIDSLNQLVTNTRAKLNNLAFTKQNETQSYLWISDNFTNNTYVDPKSTCFVNINSNYASLNFSTYKKVTDFTVTLNNDELIAQGALPGCNILLNKYVAPKGNSSPIVQYDNSPSTSIAELTDNDPTSWFEVEKNYIYLNQALITYNHGYYTDPSGSTQNVKTITSDGAGTLVDWTANVLWPGASTTSNTSVASFIDSSIVTSSPLYSSLTTTITLTLNNPQPLSLISVLPYIRTNYPNLEINSIQANVQGLQEPFVITENTYASTGNTSNTISNNLLQKYQQGATEFSIPTTRNVTSLVIKLSSPVVFNQYFGHPFGWLNIERRSERNYVLFTSVDTQEIPQRISVINPLPVLDATVIKPDGASFLNLTISTPVTGTVTSSDSKGGLLSGLTGLANSVADVYASSHGASAAIGPLNTLIDNFLNIGGFNRTFTVTDQSSGFDVYSGARAAIAISDISLANVQYSTQSTLLTVKRSFSAPVTTFNLFTEEEIPSTWPQGNWIQYFVSFDGTNYSPITPSQSQSLDTSFKLDRPITSFYLKILLNSNSQDLSSTPKLRSYAAAGKPA